jgi:hypothetical protein
LISLFSILALGFLLGMRHATDADHVVAVSTIVTRQRNISDAMRVGALWGLGHTLTIFGVGAAMILFGVSIPTQFGLAAEFLGAALLVGLGVFNLLELNRWLGGARGLSPASEIHSHAHAHGDFVHRHRHGHGASNHGHRDGANSLARIDSLFGGMSLYQCARPLVIGVLHGLAGSAAVTLLVLSAIREPGWAMAYLVLFGLGTILGMMLVTIAIAAPFAYSGKRSSGLRSYFRVAFGFVSLSLGLYLMHHVGFVDGLLVG